MAEESELSVMLNGEAFTCAGNAVEWALAKSGLKLRICRGREVCRQAKALASNDDEQIHTNDNKNIGDDKNIDDKNIVA